MPVFKFGQSILRREDVRLITGQGRYTDDIASPEALYVAFVRSPHPAARIAAIDTSEALAIAGVEYILTAADLDADGVLDYSLPVKVPHVDGATSAETPRPLLVRDQVRCLGEPLAIVLATSATIAQDAAEAVLVDYDVIDAVVTIDQATSDGAPLVWNDRPNNAAFHWHRGDMAAIAKTLAGSAHVTKLNATVSRVSANPLEPRSAYAYIDEKGRPVLHVSHQSPHQLRNALCSTFQMKRSELRVIAGDVGGSFGMKGGLLREEPLCFWAAKYLRRPVRWTATRSESLLTDEHGRDCQITASLGLDKNGIFTALQVRFDVNIGAYLSQRSTSQINNVGGIAGVYRTPVILGEVVGHFTNTQPIAAYRGAGRPEAIYAIERLIDIAAMETGIDPAELRRRNLIPPESMPYQTPFIFRYDCGEFEANMDKALALADYSGFPERLARSRAAGRLRGIGIANPIEVAAGPVAKPGTDYARVRAHADGTITLYSGAMSVGQGLETSLTTLVSQALSVPLENVHYVQGDTDALEDGKGNGGSAALTLCGSAISLAIDDLIEQGVKHAAYELEASPLDIQFAGGRFRLADSNRSVGLRDIASLMESGEATASEMGLTGAGKFKLEQPTFPNGCHICEVEIDPDTGEVYLLGYISVEDVGRVLNPMLVDGQIQGGVAQGIGQAVMEMVAYSDQGQLETGSFMDYAMPRATDVPSVEGAFLEVPTALNPLGVKGVGEAGTVGAMTAVMNAICHALAPLGIRHVDMPATPFRVWEAIRNARVTDC